MRHSQPDWYPEWRDEAFAQLQAKTARFLGAYANRGDRYDYDVHTRALVFSEKGVAKVIADAQLVGSVSHTERTWLWSWANDSLPAGAVEDLHRVRAFGEEHGIGELTSEYLEAEDLNALGWALTAVAVRILDAEGAYRSPDVPNLESFLVYNSVRRVS